MYRNLGSKQRLSVVDHVPGCNANGHYSNFWGGAGQGVISHRLAQVFGDAKAKAISQNPCAWRREKQMHVRIISRFISVAYLDFLLVHWYRSQNTAHENTAWYKYCSAKRTIWNNNQKMYMLLMNYCLYSVRHSVSILPAGKKSLIHLINHAIKNQKLLELIHQN